MQFKDKTAIVTGASSGIGKQLSIDLAKIGCNVVLASRNKERLKEALTEVKKYNENSVAVKCDISKHAQVKKLINEVYKKYSKIDILINNAGFCIYKRFDETSLEEIKEINDVNYYSVVYTTKEVLPIMLNQGSGHIVNVSSVVGMAGFPNVAAYSAAKFAVIGFSESLYHELKPKNIDISVICPAVVRTNFFNHESWKDFPHAKRHKSVLTAEQVSKAVINKALIKKKFLITIPLRARMILFGKHLFYKSYMKAITNLPR